MVVFQKLGRSKDITCVKSDAAKHVTFTKRKKGLKKKVEELAILCGVEVCMICFGPQAGKPSSIPYSWGLPGVAHVIDKYRNLSKEDQDKKKLDNTILLEQQIKKLKSELKLKVDQSINLKKQRANYLWDCRLEGYGIDELKQLACFVMDRLREVYKKIAYLSQQQEDAWQRFTNVLEQHKIALEEESNRDSVVSDDSTVSLSHLNYELMLMLSQYGTGHQQLCLSPGTLPETQSMVFMNENAQPFQQAQVSQISFFGLPASINDGRAIMATDDRIGTNVKAYVGLNTKLPATFTDGSHPIDKGT